MDMVTVEVEVVGGSLPQGVLPMVVVEEQEEEGGVTEEVAVAVAVAEEEEEEVEVEDAKMMEELGYLRKHMCQHERLNERLYHHRSSRFFSASL